MTYEQAAEVAGIGDRTLREWRERKSSVSAAIKKAELDGMRRRLQRIERAAEEGAWQADMTWLERRYPDQWGRRDRTTVEHTGSVDVKIVADMRAVIMSAVDDIPTRRRIAAALLALDAARSGPPDGGNDSDEDEGGGEWA